MAQKNFHPFPEALAELMARRHMEQLDLAVRSDISQAAVSYYLAGKRLPQLRTIEKLARALEVAPEYFELYRRVTVRQMADEAVREGILEPEDFAAYLEVQRELRKAGGA